MTTSEHEHDGCHAFKGGSGEIPKVDRETEVRFWVTHKCFIFFSLTLTDLLENTRYDADEIQPVLDWLVAQHFLLVLPPNPEESVTETSYVLTDDREKRLMLSRAMDYNTWQINLPATR